MDGTAETIPTLAAVLAMVDGRIPLLLELKRQPVGIGPLEEACRSALAAYRGPVAVQSFDPFAMAWFARHAPRLLRGQISGDFRTHTGNLPAWCKILSRRLLLNRLSRPHFISYDVRCLPHWAPLRARAQGTPLLAWTVRTAAERQLAAHYADNVIFEGYRP